MQGINNPSCSMTMKSLHNDYLVIWLDLPKLRSMVSKGEKNFFLQHRLTVEGFLWIVHCSAVDVPNLVEIVLPKSFRLIDIRNMNDSDVSKRVLCRCKSRVLGVFRIICLFERRESVLRSITMQSKAKLQLNRFFQQTQHANKLQIFDLMSPPPVDAFSDSPKAGCKQLFSG